MTPANRFKSCGAALLLVAALSACDKPGPAETAGRKLDQAAGSAGRKIADAADKLGETLNAQSTKTGIAIDDTEVTARVKAAIFAEPGLKTLQIGVDTVNGVVTLTGMVDSPASDERARTLAGAMAGVKAVDDRLVVATAR